MKETPLSNCERSFIQNAIVKNERLDGRKNEEFRNVTINFGSEYGSVIIGFGETKVMANASCELGLPKIARPTEGVLFINVELGPMAAPHIDYARSSDLCVQITRTLDRTFKESRAIDLEALCVAAEEHVWILRVDLNILNHGGNLIDCCALAMLCALCHFKRPDVTVKDNEVILHTAAEKEQINIGLHHHPVCVSFAIFDNGKIAIADPTAIEERASESQMIFGVNSYREICSLHLGGRSVLTATKVLQISNSAAKRGKFLVDMIKRHIEHDSELRAKGESVGFADYLSNITSLPEERLQLRLRNFTFGDVPELQLPNIDMAEKSDTDDSDENMDLEDESESVDEDALEMKKLENGWLPSNYEEPEANSNEDNKPSIETASVSQNSKGQKRKWENIDEPEESTNEPAESSSRKTPGKFDTMKIKGKSIEISRPRSISKTGIVSVDTSGSEEEFQIMYN